MEVARALLTKPWLIRSSAEDRPFPSGTLDQTLPKIPSQQHGCDHCLELTLQDAALPLHHPASPNYAAFWVK